MRHKTMIAQIEARINKNGPIPIKCPELGSCWIWTGFICKHGYPLYGAKRAHRLILQLSDVVIMPHQDVHHKCNNRICVNLNHLEVTNTEHRGFPNKEKTHCPRGHVYSHTNSRSQRVCIKCQRMYRRNSYHRLKNA